jgi:hypothetical protein
MPHHVHLVLSLPPTGVEEEAYGDWYELHVSEILETPGFIRARRYWLDPASPDRPGIEHRHLAVYLIDKEADPLGALSVRVQAGELTLHDWFKEIRFHAYGGRPLEDVELTLPDHGYLVFSHAPKRFTTEEYYGWYYAHARENLTSDGFETVWRYALTPERVDPDGPKNATHGAFYEVNGELPELRAALAETAQARRVDIPDWMPEGDFVSYDCRAASPAVTPD